MGWHQVSQNPMKFRPWHDRVVIRRLNAEEKTVGGIIIPDTAQEKPMEGEVIAVGPGARNEEGQIVALEVKAGDRILFGKWSGTEVKLDGVLGNNQQRTTRLCHRQISLVFAATSRTICAPMFSNLSESSISLGPPPCELGR